MRLRPMEKKDISAIAELEQICFHDPWNENMIRDMFGNDFDKVFVIEYDEQSKNGGQSENVRRQKSIAGYVNLRVLADEGELMRICVAPKFRRRGLAGLMMNEIIQGHSDDSTEDITEESDSDVPKKIFLEVRESNTAARELYKKFGFKDISRRVNYYTGPDEDAIIMER